MPSMMPITRALLIAGVAGYALQWLTDQRVVLWLALWPPGGDGIYEPRFQPWQLFTYAFQHDPNGIAHLLFNMFALYMFGSEVERLLGARRYLVYFFGCVLGAALAQLGINALSGGPSGPMLGASGGVFGLLLAFGLAFPHRKLMLLFPPIPMPAWLFVTLYGVLEFVLGVARTADGVAHFAHLGGMAAGLVMILWWRATGMRRR
jgi:membrane associated rhomboid family serine protease